MNFYLINPDAEHRGILLIKGDKLIIEIDLTKDFGPSKSGKTITIASTRGNQRIEGTDAVIGLNVYKYPESV